MRAGGAQRERGAGGEQKRREREQDKVRWKRMRVTKGKTERGRVNRRKNVRCNQKEAWRKLQEMAHTQIEKGDTG